MQHRVSCMTFNIRRDLAEDGANHFRFRFPLICRTLREARPALVCFQELMPTARRQMEEALPDYTFVGCGRWEDYGDEACAIAFLRAELELLSLEVFWLSQEPDKPGSRYPGQGYFPRVCTAAVLRHRVGGAPFCVYNTHLDHEQADVRLRELRQILARIEADRARFGARPVVLCGDFNFPPDAPEADVLKAFAAPLLVDLAAGLPFTFHDYFKPDSRDGGYMKKIDYFLVDADTARMAGPARAVDVCEGGVYLSDHYPVCAELLL